MIRIEPCPRWQPNEIVLTIELKSLDVGFDDLLVFWICLDVINVKAGFVVFVTAFGDGLVLDLEVLDVLRDVLVAVLVVWVFVVTVGTVFAISTDVIYKVLCLSTALLFQHLIDHLCLKTFSDLQQFVDVLPVNFASFVDELLVFFQI
jgi:hypothetical protein